jgi:hypothetical protein
MGETVKILQPGPCDEYVAGPATPEAAVFRWVAAVTEALTFQRPFVSRSKLHLQHSLRELTEQDQGFFRQVGNSKLLAGRPYPDGKLINVVLVDVSDGNPGRSRLAVCLANIWANRDILVLRIEAGKDHRRTDIRQQFIVIAPAVPELVFGYRNQMIDAHVHLAFKSD